MLKHDLGKQTFSRTWKPGLCITPQFCRPMSQITIGQITISFAAVSFAALCPKSENKIPLMIQTRSGQMHFPV